LRIESDPFCGPPMCFDDNGWTYYEFEGGTVGQLITGRKFNDLNGDCIQDPGELGLPGWRIIANPGGYARLTNANGDYSFGNLYPGTYTISEVISSPSPWEQTCPATPGTYNVILSLGETINDLDFGNRLLVDYQDLKVSVGGTRARPGFIKTYTIDYENIGSVSVDATVTLTLPSEVAYVLSSAGGVYNPGPHNVVWAIGVLTPGQMGALWATATVGVTVPIGTMLTSTAQIDPIAGDENPADNIDSETQEVRGSYDPNEKHVTPEGDIAVTELLRYHIDFQNVGNDTAFNIVIIDTLDPNIEMASMITGASSHGYELDIIDRELTWTFTDILLPDSIINEPGSHGFVEFTALPIAETPIGTDIENRASIFFDFNPPVITNTVINTIALRYPYLPGDVNMYVGGWGGAGGPLRQSSDVTYLVNFFKGGDIEPCYLYNDNYTGTAPSPGFFWASADFNGNCKVQSSDVTRLVNLFKGAIPEEEILRYCGYDQPDQENYFAPLWPNAGDPGEALPQEGWTGLPNVLCLPLPPPPTNVRVIPSANSD